MSIQEMKSRLHQFIDSADESALERLLDSAKLIVADQSAGVATLADLTDQQRQQLEQAIQEHKDGKTVSHEVMRQRHRECLTK
ncbi:hypothetical protein [Spirosoma koreense]